MNSESKSARKLRLFRTAPHACSYLPGKKAVTVFLDPTVIITTDINSQLSELGFRRSGAHIYRPDCIHCQACISCRIPVDEFVLTKRHRRIQHRNREIRSLEVDSLHNKEAFELYCRYINTRHADGDMFPATEEQYLSFIATKTDSTRFLQFHLDGELVAVSVMDMLAQGISAVYTYYDPRLKSRSLGTWIILWQTSLAKRLSLPYVYLGYWVDGCPKMTYKAQFQPLEILKGGQWMPFTSGQT